MLTDGTELPADIIVYATGHSSQLSRIERVVGRQVAERVGPTWGYGSGTRGDEGPWEGELRNMWKPTAQRGLWCNMGGLNQARIMTRFLALQLKARLEGLDTRVYGKPIGGAKR